jgi:streptogramin lyase
MTGRLIGTGVGAALGIAAVLAAPATFGATLPLALGTISAGAALGGLAGGLIDSATQKFDDVVNRQERLADLSIQTSTLGVAQPQLFGTVGGIAGNVVWATAKMPQEHREVTEPQGGKGGPTGPRTVNVRITYTISYAIALCDTRISGPIAGISAIWKNSNLYWDMATNGPELPEGWTFYAGTHDQPPDPTIEAEKGVGNVPRWPYRCYVVIANDDLGASGQTPVYQFTLYQQTSGRLGILARSGVSGDIWATCPDLEQVWRISAATHERVAVLAVGATLPKNRSGDFVAPIAVDSGGTVWSANLHNQSVAQIDGTTNALVNTFGLTDTPASNIICSAGYTFIETYNPASLEAILHRLETSGIFSSLVLGDSSVIPRLAVGADGDIWRVNSLAGTALRISSALAVVATVSGLGEPIDIAAGADGHLWVVDRAGDVVRRINPASNTVVATVAVGDGPVAVGIASDGFVWVGSAVAQSLTRINPADNTAQTFSGLYLNRTSAFESLLAPAPGGAMWVACRDSHSASLVSPSGTAQTVRTAMQPVDIVAGATDSAWVASLVGNVQEVQEDSGVFTAPGLSLGNALPVIVTRLCQAVGLTQIDVSALPSDLVNMVILNVEAVRVPLEQLAHALRFYAVESGQVLKFRSRGAGGLVFALTEDDLGAGEEQADEQGLRIERAPEAELPSAIDLTYIDPLQHYQRSTQTGQLSLPVSGVENARTINVGGVVLSADRARQLATELVVEASMQRETLQSTLSRRFVALEPGDRGTITARGMTYTAVLTETTYGAPGLLEFTARLDAAYIREALMSVPATPPPNPQTPPVSADTTPLLINVYALTQEDKAPRYHVAYRGEREPWPGAALYRSLDAEATYQFVDSGVLEAITGAVQGTVPMHDHYGMDTTTVLTVVLDYGTLSSVSDLALYNGANRALVGHASWGWEVMGFGEATLVGTDTYELTRIIWGRRGTEWATSMHIAGETFIVIDAGLRPVPMTMAARHITLPYKAVTTGQSIADVDPVTFAPSAENLRPWAVAQPEATADGPDWVFTWRLRSRFNAPGLFGPIGFDEDFSAFRVDIYTDTTYASVARSTLTDGGNPLDPEAIKTWTYDNASQVADFGAPQTTVYWRVYTVGLSGVSRALDMLAA